MACERTDKSSFRALYFSMIDEEHKEPSVYKLVCVGPEERVVGVHIIGLGSDEVMQGFGVAVKMGATKEDLDNTVAIHPTSAEGEFSEEAEYRLYRFVCFVKTGCTGKPKHHTVSDLTPPRYNSSLLKFHPFTTHRMFGDLFPCFDNVLRKQSADHGWSFSRIGDTPLKSGSWTSKRPYL